MHGRGSDWRVLPRCVLNASRLRVARDSCKPMARASSVFVVEANNGLRIGGLADLRVK